MELAFAAVLIIVTIVSALALAIGIPLAIGMLAYDVVSSRKVAAEKAPGTSVSIAVKRGIARAFVLGGGVFWSLAAFIELSSPELSGAEIFTALVPLGACLATLVVGWYYERFTAAALLVGALAVIAYGVIYQFAPGVWTIVTFMLIGPMLTAAALFWAARRDQESYERATALRPQLALVFDARSSLAA